MKKDRSSEYFIKALKLTSYMALFLWGWAGILVVGSIYLSQIGLEINIIMGITFLLIGFFVFVKEKKIIDLLKSADEDTKRIICKRVLKYEIVSVLIISLIGFIGLTAVITRVFEGGEAVFG